MNFFKEGKTNLKYVLIVVILIFFIVGLILDYFLAGPVTSFVGQIICSQKGGDWGRWGLSFRPYCNIRYPDGGKPCTDSDQCQGDCITFPTFDISPFEITKFEKGVCEYYHATFGCYGRFEDGKVVDLFCI